MVTRESFLLRTSPEVLNALRRWARDELRSVNSQVEYLLRAALKDAGRLPPPDDES
ncbi:MAG: Arc family DNA-binding protein [Acidobacteriota bacterium]|nr:Arc family DNA-binding protein [Acidobacteriota bacterium]